MPFEQTGEAGQAFAAFAATYCIKVCSRWNLKFQLLRTSHFALRITQFVDDINRMSDQGQPASSPLARSYQSAVVLNSQWPSLKDESDDRPFDATSSNFITR